MADIEQRKSSEPVYTDPSSAVFVYLVLKRMLFHLCKLLGLFRLSRRLTRDGLRILCYHGFAIDDECSFSRRTFISSETFTRRLAYLKKGGFPVLVLEEALDALEDGTLSPDAIVITIDDGFYSVKSSAFPLLAEHGFPFTVYITSYYAVKGTPVFNLVIQYMFWKSRMDHIDLRGLGMPGLKEVSFRDPGEKARVMWDIIRYGDSECNEEGRLELSRRVGAQLGVDYEAIARNRMLSIMTLDEIEDLVKAGVDIQLHAHRHSFPLDRERAIRELEMNREVLEPIVGSKLHHFCYPSGIWSREQWPWLSETGIRSAVTCDRGLNFKGAPMYGLLRIGDDEGLSQIEFEAEISGFTELFRKLRNILLRSVGSGR